MLKKLGWLQRNSCEQLNKIGKKVQDKVRSSAHTDTKELDETNPEAEQSRVTAEKLKRGRPWRAQSAGKVSKQEARPLEAVQLEDQKGEEWKGKVILQKD